jgi:hypothetical protein
MLMSRGKKKEILRDLKFLRNSLDNERDRNNWRMYGCYEQVICDVRKFQEYLKETYGRHRNYGPIKKGTNWAHHHSDDTKYKHTDVTDSLQDDMLEALWEVVEDFDIVSYEGDTTDDYGDDDDLCGAFNNMNVDNRAQCKFWKRGYCKFGSSCRFRHS